MLQAPNYWHKMCSDDVTDVYDDDDVTDVYDDDDVTYVYDDVTHTGSKLLAQDVQ
jgi:hypothetical protein